MSHMNDQRRTSQAAEVWPEWVIALLRACDQQSFDTLCEPAEAHDEGCDRCAWEELLDTVPRSAWRQMYGTAPTDLGDQQAER